MSDLFKLAQAYAHPERLTEAEQQDMMAFAERLVSLGPVKPLEPAEELLQILTAQLPPPEGAHGLVLLEGRLGLTLQVPGGSQVVHLDPEDRIKSPQELAAEVVEACVEACVV